MQSQIHASAEESKQQNQTAQQSIPTPVESQAVFEDRRPQSVQLKATKASINASPQQRNLRALQTRMNTGLPVQQLKAQHSHIRQFPSNIDQESPRNKLGTGSESTMPLTGLPPSEPNNTGLFDDLKSEVRNPSEQTQEQMQAKTQPQRNLHGNDRLQLKHEADRKGARTLQMQPVPRPSAKDKRKDKSNVTQRSPFSSNAILQLEKKEVQATGVTHLVKLNELGSLYQEDFISNEIAETQRGDIIQIDTDKLLRSRRGPNQEIDPLRDKGKDPDNTWANALSFNKRELPPKTYIRDGTFGKKTEEEQAEDERKGSLLLSYDIPVSGPVYLIDASHRGDMYQLRAALAVKNYPLIVYNFKGENDLTNYLSNAPDVNIYKLPYNPAAPEVEDFISGRVYRSLEVLSESDATKIIVSAPQKANDIQRSMRTIPERCIAGIDEAVEKVFSGISGNVALLMYRDSGQTNLVYPELDSGKALPTLGRMMQEKGFTPVFCGAPNSPPKIHNIGFYWTALDHIPKLANDEIPKENPKKFKRDIEAEFMKRAYDKGKFKIVVGFRSGALDLFTLLGIPTISIGLRNLVGEDRHSKYVGDPTWKRTNIQYDIPRSDVTKLMHSRGDSALYMSPFWKMRTPDTEPPLEKDKFPSTASAPLDFHPADLDTISKGLDIGIEKLTDQLTFNAVVIRAPDHVADLPEGLRKIGISIEEEGIKQKEITDWWHRQAEAAVTVLESRLKHELNLISDSIKREEKAKNIPDLVKQEFEEEKTRLASYLESRRKIIDERTKNTVKDQETRTKVIDEREKRKEIKKEKKREKNPTQVSETARKQEPKKKEAKPLSENAEKVLRILQKAFPGRVSLPDSRNETAVREIFEMSPKEFIKAYRELSDQEIVDHDKDGPYLL